MILLQKKEEEIYCIGVKFSRISEETIKKVYGYINGTDVIPVLVTAFEVKEKEKCIYKEKYLELEIIDISNLLYVVKDTDELKYELISMFPFSVEDISPKKSFIYIVFLDHYVYTVSMINELHSWSIWEKIF